jgi:hypothetical protein
MIAMANPLADYMTVRDAMAALSARSHTTVLRLVYDEEKLDTAPAGRPLPAIKIAGHGWLIRRAAVKALLTAEAQATRSGYPRGKSRRLATKKPRRK